MKQTAVEWLVEQICGDHIHEWKKEIEQAKQMEKEQIIEAVESTIKSVKLTDDKTAFFAMGGEGYYNETFKSE